METETKNKEGVLITRNVMLKILKNSLCLEYVVSV